MNKQDFIDLIKVAEGIMTLEKACKIMSGVGFDEGEGSRVFVLWEVIRRNSAICFQSIDNNIELDIEHYRAFTEILQSESMTPEEKYEKLIERCQSYYSQNN